MAHIIQLSPNLFLAMQTKFGVLGPPESIIQPIMNASYLLMKDYSYDDLGFRVPSHCRTIFTGNALASVVLPAGVSTLLSLRRHLASQIDVVHVSFFWIKSLEH